MISVTGTVPKHLYPYMYVIMCTPKKPCDSNTAPNEDSAQYARQIFDLGEGGSSSRKWCDPVTLENLTRLMRFS